MSQDYAEAQSGYSELSVILLLTNTNTQAGICHLKACQPVKVLNGKNFAGTQGHKKFSV
jgi:hypothetical protein